MEYVLVMQFKIVLTAQRTLFARNALDVNFLTIIKLIFIILKINFTIFLYFKKIAKLLNTNVSPN